MKIHDVSAAVLNNAELMGDILWSSEALSTGGDVQQGEWQHNFINPLEVVYSEI